MNATNKAAKKAAAKKITKPAPRKKEEKKSAFTPIDVYSPSDMSDQSYSSAPDLAMTPDAAPEQHEAPLIVANDQPVVTVKTDRAGLLAALTVARDFVGKKNSLPILTNILIVAETVEQEPSRLTLTVTDIETAWVRALACEITGPVSRCIPVDLLLAEVKALSEDVKDVEIAFRENSVQVNARCDIYTAPAADYPAVPKVSGEQIDVPGLIEALDTVLPAVGESDARYILNGACVDFRTGKVVGTDGHRLHMETIDPQYRDSLVIPRRAIELMVKHNAGTSLTIQDEHFACNLAEGVMTGRLITGLFPDYSKVIPETNPIHVEFSAKELLKIFEGALPLAKDRTRSVRLIINGKMEIQTSNPERGEYKWFVEAKAEGKGEGLFSITFNADYLTEAIRSYTLRKGADLVHLEMSEALSPCVVNGKAVVMPMRGEA